MNRIFRLWASMGVGLLPGPRGTYASLVVAAGGACWLGLGGGPLAGWAYWLLLALVCVLAFYSAQVALRRRVFGQGHDPGQIVTDEAAGMLLAMYGIGHIGWQLAAALLLFRLFDILKLFPVNQAERLPGAWGVVADDLVAALYALLVIFLAEYFLVPALF